MNDRLYVALPNKDTMDHAICALFEVKQKRVIVVKGTQVQKAIVLRGGLVRPPNKGTPTQRM